MASKKTKKILISLGVIGTLAAAAAVTIGAMNGNIFGQNNEPQQLAQVLRVDYDNKDCLLSWDIVEHADSYNVSINGEKQVVTENTIFYVPTEQTTEFQIQALDSTGEYKNSNWSDTLTYTIPENEVSYASVNSFVSTMMPSDYKLVKLINISIDSNDNKTYTNAVFKRDGKLSVYELRTSYNTEINSLKDAIEIENAGTRILDYYDIANYDSANSLLKSNSYVGQMEEYRQQGYKFEVVSQQVGKADIDNSVFNIYATYKLTKDNDIKYVNNRMGVVVKNTSPNEKTNYTTRVENAEDRILYEEYFKVLSGDEINVAKDMEEANVPLTFDVENTSENNFVDANRQNSYYTYSSDDDYSL